MERGEKLFESFKLGGVEVKNRIALAPLTRSRAGKTRVANELMMEYYCQRSSAGLIITEATFISEQGIGWKDAPGIYNAEQVEGWKRLVEGFHERTGNKTPIFLQLWHMGRSAHSSFHEDGSLPVAPSPIAITNALANTPIGKVPYEVPHALTREEIQQVVADYKRAAENAKEAGFDGVEIHSANGYLPDEFLQSKTNQREDEYGGSYENRFRFLREVLEAITSVFPSDRVGLRLSPNGTYNDMGSLDYKESFTYYLQQLNQFNLAYAHVMDGLGFGFHQLGEPITLKYVRQHYKGNLIGNCGYDFESAKNAVASGDADLIAFGRPFIANPDLVERFQNNWPLADLAPTSLWYSPGPVGYTDFPPYLPSRV